MKTPMQELLEEVINAREIAMGVDFRSALDFVRDAIEQDYLEKEKELFKQSFHNGFTWCCERELTDEILEDYKETLTK